jgi:ABC-2 type transport system permease protein
VIGVAGAVVGSSLRTLRRGTVSWSIGLAALVGVTVAFWPAFRGSSGISTAIDQLPAGVVQAFGLEDFGSPAGFLRGNLYELIVPLLFAIAAVALVNGQTAGDEAAGRLELFLAQPVDRGVVYVARAVAAAMGVSIIVLITLVVQLASGSVVDLTISPGFVVATLVLCGLLALLHGAVAFVVAAASGRPGLVLGVGVGLAVAGYLVAALFPLSDALAGWRHLSPWDWAFGGHPLEAATDLWRYLAVGIPSVVLVGFGALLLRRRDIAAA